MRGGEWQIREKVEIMDILMGLTVFATLVKQTRCLLKVYNYVAEICVRVACRGTFEFGVEHKKFTDRFGQGIILTDKPLSPCELLPTSQNNYGQARWLLNASEKWRHPHHTQEIGSTHSA